MNASVVSIVLSVASAHFLALLSPGPDFLLLVKSGMKNRFRDSVGLSAGIACANGACIAVCVFGLGELLAGSLVLMRIVKTGGGLFLLYIAVSAIRSRKADYSGLSVHSDRTGSPASFASEFLAGCMSGMSNPKNLVFYVSLFSMLIANGTGKTLQIGLGLWMTGLVFIWDSAILVVLSRQPVRAAFSGMVFYIDKAAGVVIGLLGIKLLFG